MSCANSKQAGDALARSAFADVQRIVLQGSRWKMAQQLVLGFHDQRPPLQFLDLLMKKRYPTCATASKPVVQVSLGFSRRGLERAGVRSHVLACFAAKAPAFMAGAALRAASHLGYCGDDAPGNWDEAYGFMAVDAVLSLHAAAHEPLEDALKEIRKIANDTHVQHTVLPLAERLPAPEDEQRVHFGYRDGLSRVGIKGWTSPHELGKCKDVSQHAAGEFLLGHPQNSGANPWIATAGQRVWPEELRAFFRNGSFGVLHQIEQDVAAFEAFVAKANDDTKLGVEGIKAKLCGRTLEGRPLAQGACTDPEADFDYAQDPDGLGCPFGSHVRRMNPRGGQLAHTRPRPLLRRGMPYGPDWQKGSEDRPRGLMGQFFCASIEDQFEHLIGQWAERVPLGSPDGGGARDPIIGAHEPGDGGFEIPDGTGRPPMLYGLRRFTRTRGVAYLFYPSEKALKLITKSDPFIDRREDEA